MRLWNVQASPPARKSIEELIAAVEILAEAGGLSSGYRPHRRSGDWKGVMEGRIEPDWSLIYQVTRFGADERERFLGWGRGRAYSIFMKNEVISRSADVMGGTPVFCGTRVPVQTLLDYLEAGDTIDEFLAGFPSVTRAQVVVADAQALPGSQAEHADLALVEVVVDVERGLADLDQGVGPGQRRVRGTP